MHRHHPVQQDVPAGSWTPPPRPGVPGVTLTRFEDTPAKWRRPPSKTRYTHRETSPGNKCLGCLRQGRGGAAGEPQLHPNRYQGCNRPVSRGVTSSAAGKSLGHFGAEHSSGERELQTREVFATECSCRRGPASLCFGSQQHDCIRWEKSPTLWLQRDPALHRQRGSPGGEQGTSSAIPQRRA